MQIGRPARGRGINLLRRRRRLANWRGIAYAVAMSAVIAFAAIAFTSGWIGNAVSAIAAWLRMRWL
jgi:hypothetical protein